MLDGEKLRLFAALDITLIAGNAAQGPRVTECLLHTRCGMDRQSRRGRHGLACAAVNMFYSPMAPATKVNKRVGLVVMGCMVLALALAQVPQINSGSVITSTSEGPRTASAVVRAWSKSSTADTLTP